MQMYNVCDVGEISESIREKLDRDIQNGDDINRTDKRQFLLTEDGLKSFLMHVLSQIGVLTFVLWESTCIFGLKKNNKNSLMGPLLSDSALWDEL